MIDAVWWWWLVVHESAPGGDKLSWMSRSLLPSHFINVCWLRGDRKHNTGLHHHNQATETFCLLSFYLCFGRVESGRIETRLSAMLSWNIDLWFSVYKFFFAGVVTEDGHGNSISAMRWPWVCAPVLYGAQQGPPPPPSVWYFSIELHTPITFFSYQYAAS